MKATAPLPLSKVAFDDPGTRQVYERAKRRALRSLLIRGVVWCVLLGVATLGPDEETQLVQGVASFGVMVWSFFLIGPANSVRWYAMVGRVLKSGPWQNAVAVVRPDVKVGAGPAVELQVGSAGAGAGAGAGGGVVGDGQVSAVPASTTATAKTTAPIFAVRAPRRHRRRVSELEQGAWFVGEPDWVGVISEPGGDRFMVLQLHRS
ncbi:hypothetical protein ACFYWS_36010 [Streptomyces sp. NPDC002795]|uniref:hypothetical protein n=1 Tax=Streptomyces sp. NPDC002795 TaxID=3364665 RepID=UPI0036D01C45